MKSLDVIIRGILSSLTPTKVNGGQYMDMRLLLDDNFFCIERSCKRAGS